MLSDSAPIAFLATADAARSRAFYEGALGLAVVEDSPFALVLDLKGVMLRVQKVQALTPAPHTALGWKVQDLRQTMAGLLPRGVVFERFAGVGQDELGIWTSPSGAQIAWFRDPDGSLLSLTQF